MKLPIAVSLPHAGTQVPEELRDRFLLDADAVREDGDDGAALAYRPLCDLANVVSRATMARAVIDMNRDPADRRADGIVKTTSIFAQPVWSTPLAPNEIDGLVAKYHRPYHDALSQAGADVALGIDCHTMLDRAPVIEANAGEKRPMVCVATAPDAGGTLPDRYRDALVARLKDAFDGDVLLNRPFRGGYIIRHHAAERPWVMLELSRSAALDWDEKARRMEQAIVAFCGDVGLRAG